LRFLPPLLGEQPFAETIHSPETAKVRSALQHLKASFAYTHKALSSITEQNAKLPIKHPLFDMITLACQSSRGATIEYIDLSRHSRTLWQANNVSGSFYATFGIPSPDGHYLAIHASVTSGNLWMLQGF